MNYTDKQNISRGIIFCFPIYNFNKSVNSPIHSRHRRFSMSLKIEIRREEETVIDSPIYKSDLQQTPMKNWCPPSCVHETRQNLAIVDLQFLRPQCWICFG